MTTLIGVPCYDGRLHFAVVEAIGRAGLARRMVRYQQNSILTKCFNMLWCEALNARANGVTHFAMVHADVMPDPGWLDRMHDIMEEHKADVLSVAMPLKSKHGLTSTAVNDDPPRRFTLRQLHAGPETFTAPNLLVNTGLMLVDFRKPWVETIAFRFDDKILNTGDGFVAVNLPEDWAFSFDASSRGARICVTRAIGATHFGIDGFRNDEPWGTMAVDEFNGAAVLDAGTM